MNLKSLSQTTALVPVFIASAIASLSFAAPAQADVFSGTHPKLGRVNLTMNTYVEHERRSVREYLNYIYSIRSGSITAYGQGQDNENAFGRKKNIVRIEDTDNYGEVCRGSLNRAWWGEDLKVIFTYDDQGTCPVAGESYSLTLYRQPDNIGMAIGHTQNPIEKIWISSTLRGDKSGSYVIPGDLIEVGQASRSMFPVSINGTSGYLDMTQLLLNREHPAWGI